MGEREIPHSFPHEFRSFSMASAEQPVPGAESSPHAESRPGAGPRRAPSWLLALACGLLAGAAAASGGERGYRAYKPMVVLPPNYKQMNTYERQAYMGEQVDRLRPPAELKNTALAYGLLGSLLAAAMGLAGGLARGSIRVALATAAGGAVAGAGTGGGLAAVLTPVFFRLLDPFAPLLAPVVVHGGIWCGIGVVGGLAFGLAYAGPSTTALRAGLGGLLGALVATVVFELVNAFAFPMVIVAEPVPPERTLRLLAHFAVAVAASLGAALVVPARVRKTPASYEV
jgi:hypothetical protein